MGRGTEEGCRSIKKMCTVQERKGRERGSGREGSRDERERGEKGMVGNEKGKGRGGRNGGKGNGELNG